MIYLRIKNNMQETVRHQSIAGDAELPESKYAPLR